MTKKYNKVEQQRVCPICKDKVYPIRHPLLHDMSDYFRCHNCGLDFNIVFAKDNISFITVLFRKNITFRTKIRLVYNKIRGMIL